MGRIKVILINKDQKQIFNNVEKVRHVYQYDNRKSHWIFMYWKPRTTDWKHAKYWDYVAVEWDPYRERLEIDTM